MSGSPNTYDGSVDKRSQMHIGTIHAQHDVEVAHQNEFLLQSIEMGGSIYNLLILFCPFIHYRGFILTTSEKEDVAVWMIVDKLLDNFFHQLYGVNLAFVSCKWGYTYPRFGYMSVFQIDNAIFCSKYFLWQAIQITFFFAKIDVNSILTGYPNCAKTSA